MILIHGSEDGNEYHVQLPVRQLASSWDKDGNTGDSIKLVVVEMKQ